MSSVSPRFAVIIPACDEAAVLGRVLAALRAQLPPERFAIVVGVNGTSDATAQIASEAGALVALTSQRGYGYGCQAAIERIDAESAPVDAYIFFAADGANEPADIAKLVEAFGKGASMVLGCRTRTPSNWNAMNFHYVLANRLFGALCGLLTGRFFADLGPLRLIERQLFHALELQEWTFGWTIEAQVRAAMLNASIFEVPVSERERIAGQQKVSHVSWRRTLSVGWQIVRAGVRTRFRTR